jgi:hypothetical protein
VDEKKTRFDFVLVRNTVDGKVNLDHASRSSGPNGARFEVLGAARVRAPVGGTSMRLDGGGVKIAPAA